MSSQRTIAAFDDPQVGDTFSEMLTFWVRVTGRDGDNVEWATYAAVGNEQPHSGPVTEFRRRFAYRSIPGYWVDLVRRGEVTE